MGNSSLKTGPPVRRRADQQGYRLRKNIGLLYDAGDYLFPADSHNVNAVESLHPADFFNQLQRDLYALFHGVAFFFRRLHALQEHIWDGDFWN